MRTERNGDRTLIPHIPLRTNEFLGMISVCPHQRKGQRSLSLTFDLSFEKYIFSNGVKFFVGNRASTDLVLYQVWCWDGYGIMPYKCVQL